MKKIIFISFFIFTQTASAQVVISEIKYTGNEWVEISNTGAPVDISTWRFFEGGTNHKLKAVQGVTSVPAGGYAIIANDATAFLNEHGGFTGTLFDSSFSLLDAGETVSIKSSDTSIEDTVTYTGIKGSKNTAQKIDGAWVEAVPTPGAANGGVVNTAPSLAAQNIAPAPADIITSVRSFPIEPQIIADAGQSTRSTSSGAPITFTGRVFGLKKEPIENARLVWSFGDGGHGEGMSVSHTYYYPGEYVVVLEAASGYYSASDRITVRVSEPLLFVSTGGDAARSFVTIENRNTDEVDLSFWQVLCDGKTFTLPQNTILGSKKILTLPSEISGLTTPSGSSAFLNFPNGSRVAIKNGVTTVPTISSVVSNPIPKTKSQAKTIYPVSQTQKASVIDALPDSQGQLPAKEEGSLWLWYVSAAFLGALALLGLRLAKNTEEKAFITADDFEIIEEPDDEEPH